ncbi:MAG TPA: 2-oxoglutarate and iron-dependent oxygenase domain-containing protein, partial [Terriglobales bacterium]|nr:2-oxoglutarate and iron-dependent oxygenase domain-containing protein [Terriglobales bacterium]
MAIGVSASARAGTTIPVIDFGPAFAGRPGARDAAAAALRDILEQVGFFVMVNHGVPQQLIDQTFAEARRFHDQPMDQKLALKMNEHNNGYMMQGRYAVWTSEVNTNDKPDLNEAWFCKRERDAADPLRRSGRRFVGPNQWPDALPGFRDNVLAYLREMDALSARLLPVVAVALELAPDAFDAAFAESQFSFRLTHYPPVAAAPNQFGIAPHTDANFLTFLAQSDVPGLQV